MKQKANIYMIKLYNNYIKPNWLYMLMLTMSLLAIHRVLIYRLCPNAQQMTILEKKTR